MVDGAGESLIRAQAQDSGAMLLGCFGGAVFGSVIDGDHFGDRIGLCAQLFEQTEQEFTTVPHRDNDRNLW